MAEIQTTTWQPIATAPVDQTVLLWNGHVSVGQRNGFSARWRCLCSDDYAWEGDGNTGSIVLIDNPTHWMPIPESPHEG